MKTCWQIRMEDLDNAPGPPRSAGGAGGAGWQWRKDCVECQAYTTDVSCWELDKRCCAPVHVTCDFCSLYLAHRREITILNQQDGFATSTKR